MATHSSGMLIQSTFGTKGHFELAAPVGLGGMVHWFRNNDLPARPWRGPNWFAAGPVREVALVQSNFGSPGQFEVVALVGRRLLHYWRPPDGIWRGGAAFARGVDGAPGFVQSTRGTRGHFEVVAPLAAGGLAHWWRDNDLPARPWSAPAPFGGTTRYQAAALIESSYEVLEVVARAGGALHHFWRGHNGQWHGPTPFATGVAGAPAFIEGSYGRTDTRPGNFEVVTPLAAGGLGHWWRNNDASPTWHGPSARFGAGAVQAAGMVQSNFGTPGNLEVVARVGRRLEYFTRGSTFQSWSGPTAFYTEPSCDGPSQGECRVPYESGIVAVHAAVLRTGKVLLYSFADHDARMGETRVQDPATGALQAAMHTPHLFCGGHAQLPDGRVLVAGGHGMDLKNLHLFDPDMPEWHHVGSMPDGRWYPTCTTLADGRVMIISGTKNGGPVTPPVDGENNVNNTVQLFDPGPCTLTRELPVPSPWAASNPGFPTVDLYPFAYQLPDGRVLVHSQRTTRFYDPMAECGDDPANCWDDAQADAVHPRTRTFPGQGTSVLLPLSFRDGHRARVMIMGGTDGETLAADTPATSTAEVLDLGTTPLAWRRVASMLSPRLMPDAVLLPDGTVAVMGGSKSGVAGDAAAPVFPVEIYDPAAVAWTAMCPMRVPRLYHATALLLPDARVWIGGRDGIFNPRPYKYPEHRIEIFSPPYLFRGPRPTIDGAPDAAGYAQNITVATPQAGVIDRVVLVRPGTVTHSFNMDQRLVELRIASAAAGSITVRTPPHGRVAPPGWYMLFVLHRGVPSEARFLRLS